MLSLIQKNFMDAVDAGRADIVKSHLEDNPCLGGLVISPASNSIPLFSAILRNQVASLEALLPYSDLNHRIDSNRKTPLFFAAEMGSLACLKSLLPHCDANAANLDGETPLMAAARHGELECLRALLPFSDPNIQSDCGLTAALLAAANANSNCLEALLPVSELSVSLKGQPSTVLDFARRNTARNAPSAWACVDLAAAALSAQHAAEELLRAPPEAQAFLPRCRAVAEQALLRSVVDESAPNTAASTASAGAPGVALPKSAYRL